jgi:transglutaminase-like putative cysteine protease
MTNPRLRFLVFSVILMLLSLGCQMLAGISQPDPTATSKPHNVPQVEETPLPEIMVKTPPTGFSGTALPLDVTPVSATVDNIGVNYVYTDNLVAALYHLYGTVLDNFVDITIENDSSAPVKVIIRSEVSGYTTQSIDTIEIPANDQMEVHQNPLLIQEAVDKLNSQKPGNFHIEVVYLDQGEEKEILDETRQILIYSRRDFVWLPGFETQEEYELWGAWVTPNDPSVEALIRSAANFDPTGIITGGYGDGSNDEDGSVKRRLQAVWQAEDEIYHLTYINTTTAFGPHIVQRMRMPAEVLDQSSGNCVELAALYASVAEALGLEANIVRIPGHAYTAVRTDQENAQYYFIETTLIGRVSFSEALERGAEEWADAIPHFDAHEEGYAWVTIPDVRKKGILPNPWH